MLSTKAQGVDQNDTDDDVEEEGGLFIVPTLPKTTMNEVISLDKMLARHHFRKKLASYSLLFHVSLSIM
jgi:hypothetical protein